MRVFEESGMIEGTGVDPRVANRKLMQDMIKNGSLVPKDDSRY